MGAIYLPSEWFSFGDGAWDLTRAKDIQARYRALGLPPVAWCHPAELACFIDQDQEEWPAPDDPSGLPRPVDMSIQVNKPYAASFPPERGRLPGIAVVVTEELGRALGQEEPAIGTAFVIDGWHRAWWCFKHGETRFYFDVIPPELEPSVRIENPEKTLARALEGMTHG